MKVSDKLPGSLLALGDLLLPAEYFREAFAGLFAGRILTHDWEVSTAEELMSLNLSIEEHGPEAVAVDERLEGILAARGPEVACVVTHFSPVSSSVLNHLPNVRVIATARSGVDNIDTDCAAQLSIPIVNNPGRNANAVAEFTVGLMLSQLRGIAVAHHQVALGHWSSFEERSGLLELSDKRIGLVGFGQVGQRVAQLLSGFGCEILAFDPFLKQAAVPQVSLVPLDQLLRDSDVVSLHARVTGETRGLIGAPEFSLMRSSAVLVNTARAELVDESALVAALEGRRLAGAALDVFSSEPLPMAHPLRQLEHVTLTPHLAGSTKEAFTRAPRLLATRVRRFLDDLP